MATAKQVKHAFMGAGKRGEIVLSGVITLGGSGAISSTEGFVTSGTAGNPMTVAKTSAKTGRYTVTLDFGYTKIRFAGAPGLVGAADTAIGNTNANIAFFRNRSAGNSTTCASFDIQLALASSGADTDGASGTEIHWACIVRAF